MMKRAICNETFQNWTWEDTCRQVAELGYDGIEIAPFTLAPDIRTLDSAERAAIRRTAETAGLEIVGLHWLLVSPKGLSITSRDETVREETSRYLAGLVEFCAELGGKILVLGSPAQRRIPDGDTAADAADRLEEVLSPVIASCEQHGVTLCLEPLPPPEADFILNLREAVSLVKRFAHPSVCTILDIKSASSDEGPIPELIARYRPHIAHVHANDANRRGPGFGDTDFAPILHALNASGYAGYLSIEVFDYAPDPVTIARESLAYLQKIQEQL